MILAARLLAGQPLSGTCPVALAGVARDSRALRPGEAFVAVVDDPAEMALHAAQARAAGATVVIAEDAGGGTSAATAAAQLSTPHARWSFARASAAAHGLDRAQPVLIGVTGSTGKSTTTHCAWWSLGPGAARVGTLGWHDGSSERPGKQTTPPPEEVHAFLSGLGPHCPGVAVEISSHAGDQHRLAGLELASMVFTGLGHDHLDYHRSIGAYLTAKLKIVRQLRAGARVVVNADDPRSGAVAHAGRGAGADVVGLGFQRGQAQIAGDAEHGWRLLWEGIDHPLPVRLPGRFNAWNAAAGALAANAVGVPLATALARLADLPPVPGRLELLAHAPLTYVDYAHTPEALAVMLRALRQDFRGHRLVCVFGCGGDRDRSKRGPMGRAALTADVAVLTTDNSRSESPRAIAEDVVAGLPPGIAVAWDGRPSANAHLVVELDRAQAIRLARRLAGADGVVVVAGKGHETTQEIQGAVLPWDDRSFVASLAGEARR